MSLDFWLQNSNFKMSLGVDIFGSKNIGIRSSIPMITSEPLLGSTDYLPWASLVELWCKGQGV